MPALPALADLADLARAAGREIMDIYARGFDALTKGDGSPVTIADQRAEAIILEGLSRLAPGVPVIAEEEVAAGRIAAIGQSFFLVDPIDGTRDFVERSEDFTVNIGLIEGGVPVAGVVYAPATGMLYVGGGDQAYGQTCDPLTTDPKTPPARLRVAPGVPDKLRIVTSRRAASQALDRFTKSVGMGMHARRSSSIKFCLIAAGEADLYPRFGEVSEWDAAAGHAVLIAAGGGVMRPNGAPLIYGTRAPDFNIQGFIAYGGGEAESAARDALD